MILFTILFQDPFDPDEFVERMVRRSMQECRLKDDQFDPEMIHDIFTQAIQDLKVGGYAHKYHVHVGFFIVFLISYMYLLLIL